MQQTNLFDFFGPDFLSEEDKAIIAPPAPKKEARKTEKKPAKKAGKEKKTRSGKAEEVFSGTINVIGTAFALTVECGGKMTATEVIRKIGEQYAEITPTSSQLVKLEDGKVLCARRWLRHIRDDEEIDAQACAHLGDKVVALTPVGTDGTVKVSFAIRCMETSEPELKGFGLAKVGDLVYIPVVPAANAAVSELPAGAEFIGYDELTVKPEEGKETEPVPEFLKRSFGTDTAKVYKVNDKYFIAFETAALGSVMAGAGANTAPKPEDEKIKLPVQVAYVFKSQRDMLTPGLFDGKEEVTMKEIIDKISESYAAFKTATPSFYYVKEENVVVASVLTRGKGGAM